MKGTYFFRTSPEKESLTVAVHVAEACSLVEAKAIHRKLWNQGMNPFLIVLLPWQVRVFTGFAYDPKNDAAGLIITTELQGEDELLPATTELVQQALEAFNAEAIDSGRIWRTHTKWLGSNRRVDTTLLDNLLNLSRILCEEYELPSRMSYSLIGKFVYLSYLRARNIISNPWLESEVGVKVKDIFEAEVFAENITLRSFRKLSDAVEDRFNGMLFPIQWRGKIAPKQDAVQRVARIFAGEDALSGQGHLSFRAYDFANLPVEFLSSIYEQFLHGFDSEKPETDASNPEKGGAHYTPEPLADYLASEINSVLPLKKGMKVLDPSCGSGIFLVIAFRRLVEMECLAQGKTSLNASELKRILRSSIFGVERNELACQISGFSLILAMLSYVDPPELHRRKNFKFPDLVGVNLFNQDFFDEQAGFWTSVAGGQNAIAFDWIIGNPPWVELDSEDKGSEHLLRWSNAQGEGFSLPRKRTGEAFASRVLDCLSPAGVSGLVLHAKTLTNDNVAAWRRFFFSSVELKRITNFSNFSKILFPVAQQPAFTLICKHKGEDLESGDFLHFGPFVAKHETFLPKRGRRKGFWIVSMTESEIQTIPQAQVANGNASVWKMALWGNHRDYVAIRKLKGVLNTTLGKVSATNKWKVALGLQLRKNDKKQDRAEEILDSKDVNILEGLRVFDHEKFIKTNASLRISRSDLIENKVGLFVRNRGGKSGVSLLSGPRLFLNNRFAAYANIEFIMLHDKLGLTGGSASEMKAVAALWNSNLLSYLVFFVTNAAWGIGYDQIDKGDAVNLPFPEWTKEREVSLAKSWEKAAKLEEAGKPFADVKRFLDHEVAKILKIPEWIVTQVQEFFSTRYLMNNGKAPAVLKYLPTEEALLLYGQVLQRELDQYVAGKAFHQIRIRYSKSGIFASVKIQKSKQEKIDVAEAIGKAAEQMKGLLAAAELRTSQWFYTKRSVKVFDGNTIHLVKPPHMLEWTQSTALIDADELINEIVEERQGGLLR